MPLVQVLSIHEAAIERLDYGVCVPFGPVFVFEQILYARPARRTVELTRIPVVKKLTVLLAYVLFVLLAVFNLHPFPPLL